MGPRLRYSTTPLGLVEGEAGSLTDKAFNA